MAALLTAFLASCVGGSGGEGGTVPPPPPPSAVFAAQAGLVSAAAASGVVHLSWTPSSEGNELALFIGTDAASLFSGTPIVTNPVGDELTLSGLPNGVVQFLGVGLRASPFDVFVPTGPVLSVRPGAPIYVDPTADPLVADGTSPETAYASPLLALVDSFGVGGANIHLLGGSYPASSLPVFGGSHLYGGFAPGFELAERDPKLHPTIFHGLFGQAMAAVNGTSGVVLDGLNFSGDGLATHGIDMDTTPLELRGVSVDGCTQRGVRVRSGQNADPTMVLLTGCALTSNGSGGLSGLGNLDVAAYNSSFVGNAQEGLDLDDLIAADGSTASLRVDGCIFAFNATDGLDVDLNAPLLAGPNGGELAVEILRSSFQGNGEVGLLIDVDYIAAPAWKANIEVRGCTVRDNRKQGMLIDADERANIFVQACVAEANLLSGFEVSSSNVGGLVVFCGSAALGNGGAGFTNSFGVVELFATHCLVAGNVGGGFTGAGVGAGGQVCSSAVLSQVGAFSGFVQRNTVDLGSLAQAFFRAPEAFVVGGALVAGQLAVADSSAIASDAVVEVAADGVPRAGVTISTVVLGLDPAPADRPGPTSLMAFGPGVDVDLDLGLPSGSPLIAAGLAGLADAGPAGAPGLGGDLKLGELRAKGLHLKAIVPSVELGLANAGSLVLRFEGGTPSATGIASALVVRDGLGALVPFTVTAVGGDLQLDPAGVVWDQAGTGSLVIELLPGLSGSAGEIHEAPLSFSLSVF